MKLISLDMQNFRQHLDTSVTFTDGVTGIIGPNGSGKSTVLEAIAWALYGAPAVRGTNDTIRSKASEGGAKVNVALTFDLGGSIYRVARTLDGSGRSGSAVLEVDGKPLRSGMSEVSDAIGKLLGMDYRAFFTSFFTGQKQIEFMASLDGRARANAISKMLGYDRVTKARDQANEDKKGLNREIEALERGLGDPEELKERKKTAQASLSEAKKALEDAEKAHAQAAAVAVKLKPLKELSDQKAKRFEEISRRLDLDRSHYDRVKTRHAQLQVELADLDAKRKELDSLRDGLERYDAAGREYKQMKELQEHEGERQRLSGQIASVEDEIKRIGVREKQLTDSVDQQKRADAALEAAEMLLAEADKKLQQMREQMVAREHSAKAQIAQLEGQKSEIGAKRARIADAGAEGSCPTCERPLADELPKVLANFDSQIQEVAAQITSLQESLSAGRNDAKEIQVQQDSRDQIAFQTEQLRREKSAADALASEHILTCKQMESKSADLKLLQDDLAKLPTGFDQVKFRELQKLGEELRPVREKAVALRSALERYESVNMELQEARASSEIRLKEIEAAEKSLKELDFAVDDYSKLIADFEASSTALNEAMVLLERQRGEAKIASAMLETAVRDEEQFKTRFEELNAKKSERLHLQTLAEALDKLRAELNDRIRPELESIASELLSMMTDGRYNTLEITETYQAVIVDDGERKPVISGGEDDIVNLALRLAISQMIADRAGQSFSLLVLDEVFGSLDDVRRDNVVNLLQNLKNRFEQIILITHIESIHDAMDNCLWVGFDERTKTSRLVDRAVSEELETVLALN